MWITLAGVLTSGCAAGSPHIVDLSYPFNRQTIYWPHNKHFEWTQTEWGLQSDGRWYAAADFSAAEHGGTHIDAPIHFAAGRRTVDQIPVDRLVGPAVVVDVRSRCETADDYEISIDDLQAWEGAHGRIGVGELVLLRTGWSRWWPDAVRYLGSPTPDTPGTLHFPGLSPAAALWLIQRGIRGVGIDTASIDAGRSPDFPAHRVLNGADVYILENVADLSPLPARGAMVYALPMKIAGGSGAPTRIVAVLPSP